MPWSQQFQANALLPAGTSQAKVSATDGLNNTVTNSHQLTGTGPGGKQLTFDSNGSMTSDGTNAYLWDAQNRLYCILYPSNYFGDFTEFVYDGLDRCVKIIEYTNFAATQRPTHFRLLLVGTSTMTVFATAIVGTKNAFKVTCGSEPEPRIRSL